MNNHKLAYTFSDFGFIPAPYAIFQTSENDSGIAVGEQVSLLTGDSQPGTVHCQGGVQRPMGRRNDVRANVHCGK